MKATFRIICLLLVFLCSGYNLYSQGLGIDASSPNTKLDVNGDVAVRMGTYTANNGNNNNINVGDYSFVKISGPTGAYAVTGITGGVDGKIIIFYNSTTYDVIFSHQSGSSSSSNRIIAADNANVTVKRNGSITLIYNDTDNRWIVIAKS